MSASHVSARDRCTERVSVKTQGKSENNARGRASHVGLEG